MYICVCLYTHRWNSILAPKMRECLPFAATWMDLESITLSEISQTGKGKQRTISLLCRI